MTPTLFCEKATSLFQEEPSVKIIVHDSHWAEQQGMGSFLSVTRGSAEPAKFLEIHYKGGLETDPLLALVGKGVTFDSGGVGSSN